jgi:hypothetical protein
MARRGGRRSRRGSQDDQAPEIGDITVDCDVLNDSDTDLKIVIYTAAPGSEDATKLDLARVAGISQDSPTALPADVS